MRDRSADVAYRARQSNKGLRQLSVWVPADLQVLLVELAAIARELPPDMPAPADAPADEGKERTLPTLIEQVERLLHVYAPYVGHEGARSSGRPF